MAGGEEYSKRIKTRFIGELSSKKVPLRPLKEVKTGEIDTQFRFTESVHLHSHKEKTRTRCYTLTEFCFWGGDFLGSFLEESPPMTPKEFEKNGT